MLKKISDIYHNNRHVVNNIIGAFAVKGLSLCLSLFTMPAYIRYFQNQTILGIWYTIVSVLNWSTFFDLGLGNGLRNLLPEAIENNNRNKIKELISTTYITMVALVVIIFATVVIVAPMINWNRVLNVNESLVDNSVLSKCIVIVLAGILLQFVAKLIDSILYALQKSAIVNFLTFSSTLMIVIALYISPSTNITENLIRMSYINVVTMLAPYIIASIIVFSKLLNRIYPSFSAYQRKYVNPLMKIGATLLFLQFVFMVISSTNEYIISLFTDPRFVVEYQAYNKIFKTGAMIVSLSLTPIWSAVTKELVKKNYVWIYKTYKLFLVFGFGCLIGELCLVPFLQPIMNIWLGKGYIQINHIHGLVFAFSGAIFVFHNINTSIGNGISYFKTQVIWMGFAALIDIPLSYLLVTLTGSWIGVVLANVVALVPYEVLAPIFTLKKLNYMVSESEP